MVLAACRRPGWSSRPLFLARPRCWDHLRGGPAVGSTLFLPEEFARPPAGGICPVPVEPCPRGFPDASLAATDSMLLAARISRGDEASVCPVAFHPPSVPLRHAQHCGFPLSHCSGVSGLATSSIVVEGSGTGAVLVPAAPGLGHVPCHLRVLASQAVLSSCPLLPAVRGGRCFALCSLG